MSSVRAYVQEISINSIRKQAALVMRGNFFLVWLPIFLLLFLIFSPRFDAAKFARPDFWILAVSLAGMFALIFMAFRACPFLCKRCLERLIALQTALLLLPLLAGGAALLGGAVWLAKQPDIDLAQIDLTDMMLWLVAGLLALCLGLMFWCLYYALLSPMLAAKHPLATRLPPDNVPFMATLEQTGARPRALPSPPMRNKVRARTLKIIACLTGFAAVVACLWLFAQDQKFVALALEFGAIYVIILLWRRGARFAAVDANEQLKVDPRAPILYLRSFRDDSELFEMETDFIVERGSDARKKRSSLIKSGPLERVWHRFTTSWLSSTGGRLEEELAKQVSGIGPFVAIGAPTEPLPELGATRAYLSNDTWKNAIIRWVDSAGLIIIVIGPTKGIRWELETIIERGALSKLMILMPPGRPDDLAARWQNFTSELQPTRWGSSLAMVDSETVIAIRFFDDGGLSIITGGKRRYVDYNLAFRLLLYQLRKSARA